MKLIKTLVVKKPIFDEMQKICCQPSDGRDVEFDEGVDFGNGYAMDIQVCKGGEGEPYWTQGVLFKKHIGRPLSSGPVYEEIACTDVLDSFKGLYQIAYEENIYVVDVRCEQ